MSRLSAGWAVFFEAHDDPAAANDFQRLRKRLFVDHHGWDLKTYGDLEVDEFDRPETSYCVLYMEDAPIGGFRAIRTDREYLAQRVFPQLANTRAYPRRCDFWEISRFGVLPSYREGFSLINYGLMFAFAHERKAKALLGISELHYERYLRTIGIRTRRYGPPQVIGIDKFGRNLRCVAGEIPLDAQHERAISQLKHLAKAMRVYDNAVSERPTALSA